MKKNITINLCGRLYQIDEDAYELLSQYMDALRNYFNKQKGGKEIADDIEERVAELFDDLKSQNVEAITIEHVQGVIHQIGQVEEIAGEAPETSEASENPESPESPDAPEKPKKPQSGKKFYRDSQNKILAGVLAGCAQYMGSSANTWRWGYVILCVVWCCMVGVGPIFSLPFDGLFGGIFTVFAVMLSFLSLPIAVLPLLVYILIALFTPETKTPEDMLKMKGKEVNPQNLMTEVQEANLAKEKKKSDSSFWDIFVGVISVGLSALFAIGFIVALCFLVAFVAAHELMADRWWNIDQLEDLQAITQPVIFSGIMLLISIAILLYCSIHAAISSFGKTPSMNTRQRVIWFLLWVASVAGFVGCGTWAVGRLSKTQMARWEKEGRFETVTITDELGHVFNEQEYDFFKMNDWELITAENTDRYTYSGEWITGDGDIRYLDACNDNAPVIYTARKKEDVEPGIYRLSAAVRANNAGRFIYLHGQTIDPEKGDTTQLATQVKEIPVFATEGGNIWEYAKYGENMQDVTLGTEGKPISYDGVVNELVGRLSSQDRQKIQRANHHKGFGWNYIYIDSIRVEKPSELFYGVTTDKSITGKPATTGWFSATDFQLERIGDI